MQIFSVCTDAGEREFLVGRVPDGLGKGFFAQADSVITQA